MRTTPKQRKYMVTGGHVTPALATIEELQKKNRSIDIVFVGRKYALEGSRVTSEEFHLVRNMHIRFYPLITGRMKRDMSMLSLFALIRIPIGCIYALWIVLREWPSVIISFGGYVAFPVVLAGWLMRIPVVTHEQTRRPGLANRIISRMARYTCTGFPDAGSIKGLYGQVVYTGLPIRTGIFHPPRALSFDMPKDTLPVLFIVGGNTGSVSINTVVFESLPSLLSQWVIVHQTGTLSIEKAKQVRRSLGEKYTRYIPVAYVHTSDYSYLLHKAQLIVGRSGANTVIEIAAVGKPALFIPLPWASDNEQQHNAEYLEKKGSAVVLQQHMLNSDTLISSVTRMLHDIRAYTQAASHVSAGIVKNGAHRFISIIESV